MNIESIAEVKVLTQGYQAEYGRSSGSADHGRDQERHQPVPRVGLRHLHQLGLEREQLGQPEERRRRSRSQDRDIYGYTIGGPVGKPGGNNKLFFFYATSTGRRPSRSTAATPSGCACRRRSSARATSRRRRDNNGNLLTVDLMTTITTGAPFPNQKIPANRLYAPGVAVLNRYPLPNLDASSRGRTTTTRSSAGVVQSADPAAGDPPRLPALAEAALHGQVLRAAAAAG